ncbi:TPA: hypothetical protein ACGJSI_005911, partial [Pseudomonas aeruginosa]|uniref:hypothetical protein n=1 Tax=Pseudomonas aeruginosa TaxID=287 RepID=UPI002E806139
RWSLHVQKIRVGKINLCPFLQNQALLAMALSLDGIKCFCFYVVKKITIHGQIKEANYLDYP